MQVRVVTLRFDPVLEAFDDGPLQVLLTGRFACLLTSLNVSVRAPFLLLKRGRTQSYSG